VPKWSSAQETSRSGPQAGRPTRRLHETLRETPPMAKKSRKKKARKNSKANHGKRPNS
jgi:hypothetical protein